MLLLCSIFLYLYAGKSPITTATDGYFPSNVLKSIRKKPNNFMASKTFDDFLANIEEPVLVDFYAQWYATFTD